jgi:hypothetical protein
LGNLLIATGGVLQPSKCFYSIISFEWTNGKRTYAKNNIRGEYGITMPLPGGGKQQLAIKALAMPRRHLEQ